MFKTVSEDGKPKGGVSQVWPALDFFVKAILFSSVILKTASVG